MKKLFVNLAGCVIVVSASRVSTDKLRLWLNANPMFTGGSDDEAVCIRVDSAFVTNAGWYRQEHIERNARKRGVDMTTTARPNETIQKSLQAAAVPARGGYSAISIQDYTRISNQRSEFLNFLLMPNPTGIPAVETATVGLLKAA